MFNGKQSTNDVRRHDQLDGELMDISTDDRQVNMPDLMVILLVS
jgi:hypothetical protein